MQYINKPICTSHYSKTVCNFLLINFLIQVSHLNTQAGLFHSLLLLDHRVPVRTVSLRSTSDGMESSSFFNNVFLPKEYELSRYRYKMYFRGNPLCVCCHLNLFKIPVLMSLSLCSYFSTADNETLLLVSTMYTRSRDLLV